VAVVMPGLERRLRAELTGEVQFDAFSRGRYSTDASHYQIMPVGVVAPRTIEEADRAIAIARSEGATVLARGGDGSLPVREAMRTGVPRVQASASEVDCATLMRDHYTRHLLVEEDGRVERIA